MEQILCLLNTVIYPDGLPACEQSPIQAVTA